MQGETQTTYFVPILKYYHHHHSIFFSMLIESCMIILCPEMLYDHPEIKDYPEGRDQVNMQGQN
jgi:hypothetical protein